MWYKVNLGPSEMSVYGNLKIPMGNSVPAALKLLLQGPMFRNNWIDFTYICYPGI